MSAIRGTGQEGFLAIDDIEFFPDYDPNGSCKMMPPEANPDITTTTTTTTEKTTVTEPDKGMSLKNMNLDGSFWFISAQFPLGSAARLPLTSKNLKSFYLYF